MAADDPNAPGPLSTPATAHSLPARMRQVWSERIGPAERSMLVSWAAFGATFGSARLITHRLRAGGGAGGIVFRGRHIHHYNFGIALLAIVGALAIRGERAAAHPLSATAYGSGGALIADEFALLLDVRDVYWAREGRASVDVAMGVLALSGLYLAAAPFWHDALRELARTLKPVPADARAATG